MPSNVLDVLARLRNLAQKVSLTRRKDDQEDGTVEVETAYGKVYELRELKPYGLGSKPKTAKGICFFIGGDSRSPVLLALGSEEGLPELEDGEVALYSEYGNGVVLRKDSSLELNGKDYGGLVKWAELQGQLDKVTQILQSLQQTLQTPVTEPGNGAPSAFQASLLGALGSLQLPDYKDVENQMVQHGEATENAQSAQGARQGQGSEETAGSDENNQSDNERKQGVFELQLGG